VVVLPISTPVSPVSLTEVLPGTIGSSELEELEEEEAADEETEEATEEESATEEELVEKELATEEETIDEDSPQPVIMLSDKKATVDKERMRRDFFIMDLPFSLNQELSIQKIKTHRFQEFKCFLLE